ncbi:2-C-methyl-D-erythritol 4-phosphate cytidylyltransferase [Streptococcus agalactiae]|uniref:Ribitol-5-phosphate cytidylyltransferase n=3 Tax=Streptococcus agalactiae TaxID=1311 RepID=TARI_STRA3|nr:RecName: Full=Ribitol-5-phosphate cytidylyltransferase [Streptococcus agalactiae NEM316]APS26080.1 2-C-methyl-D-erythritol 4-phosphate cytidylyltransferase [Streptococcus agalactiae]KLJ54806.1 2-C-methyl-D-erythritol 4-phosphate cytidylyltransferase [Streptococcus agalactiae]KLK01882.1 2-C-methyl-D-erythritol 4-phosphate cytidylyltransferase [Streptococcus agalactiae]KLK04750.1 2-C-methyl-D-erythritol 4-phosphate cytidylyltransferase [Streptococcus agalactiae]KLK17408.1 2-C-methyl-D-erythri
MNIGVIFAGGVGRRMNTKGKPKQFLEVHGKPIIVHTIDIFQNTEAIDAVVVVCVSDWLDYMNNLVERFNLTKVKAVVAGGETGQMSIFKGLEAAEQLATDDAVVLIHDGVRPLINEEVINANIKSVKETGSAVTSVRAKETVVLVNDSSKISEVVDRTRSFIAKAPQSFYLSDILSVERDAISKGITDAIDSSTLMGMYNRELTIVEGPYENIKITTPDDFYMFKALYDARENEQIYGM